MKIGIIGCGNMGQALIKGLLAKGYLRSRELICADKDKSKANFVRLRYRVSLSSSGADLVRSCQVIILAVKPQDADALLRTMPAKLKGKLWISICAGLTTTGLEKRLGKVAVVRAMPNMPAQALQGITALAPGRYASAKDRKAARSIFACVGEVVEVKERLMDALTAISGSGPAYFFYLTEKLIASAKKLGLSEELAQKLVRQTALGSALLIKQSAQSPQELRQRVASKGGTTEAALKVLEKKALGKILDQAVAAAARRSRQLRQQ